MNRLRRGDSRIRAERARVAVADGCPQLVQGSPVLVHQRHDRLPPIAIARSGPAALLVLEEVCARGGADVRSSRDQWPRLPRALARSGVTRPVVPMPASRSDEVRHRGTEAGSTLRAGRKLRSACVEVQMARHALSAIMLILTTSFGTLASVVARRQSLGTAAAAAVTRVLRCSRMAAADVVTCAVREERPSVLLARRSTTAACTGSRQVR